MHNWMQGLLFLKKFNATGGANTLGNGGDATMWINPNLDSVNKVLAD